MPNYEILIHRTFRRIQRRAQQIEDRIQEISDKQNENNYDAEEEDEYF